MYRTTLIIWLSYLISLSKCQDELLVNPDFEQPFDGSWYCSGCTLKQSTDSYTGQFSAKVTERSAQWAALSQLVTIQGGRSYYFRAMVKFINQLPDYQWHQMSATLEVDYDDGEKQYIGFGSNPHMEVAHGWQIVGGDATTKPKGISRARLYFPVSEAGVSYIVDSTSLTEIIPNPSWLEDANRRIEQIRKSDITLAVNISGAYNPGDITLQVNLTRHAVPFGSAINSNRIVGSDQVNQRYQQFFYENFEYSVIENSLKWRAMEPVAGIVDYETSRNAINALEQNGIPVRGHCVFWEKEEQVPDWLRTMSGEQVLAQVYRRAEYVVKEFSGRLSHWDVNNEDLHGTFFKSKTGDTSIINTMFSEVKRHDPDSKTFLNEYGIVTYSQVNHAIVNQAIRLNTSGVPVYGIGVQSHINGGFINPDLYLKRLDVAALAGLPLWLSEVSYGNEDQTARADGYETLLRLYYSHPAVEGILLWGFWDGAHFRPEAAIVEGDDFVLNEAGRRYQALVKGEWHTSAALQPLSSTEELSLRGFQGSYNVIISYRGNAIKTVKFDVPNEATSFRVEIDI